MQRSEFLGTVAATSATCVAPVPATVNMEGSSGGAAKVTYRNGQPELYEIETLPSSDEVEHFLDWVITTKVDSSRLLPFETLRI